MRSLLIAAHGERGGLRANRLPLALAELVRQTDRFCQVGVGYIRGEPPIEAVAAGLPDGQVDIYPLFMSAGYYVNEAIPERLSIAASGRDARGRPVRVMTPIGVRPVMARIVAGRATRAATGANLRPSATTLLLVAHGSSKDSASREATLALGERISRQGAFADVSAAFLEEPPSLDDALGAMAGPLVVFGLFIGEGLHGNDDLKAAVQRAGRSDLALAPALAQGPELAVAARDDILEQLTA